MILIQIHENFFNPHPTPGKEKTDKRKLSITAGAYQRVLVLSFFQNLERTRKKITSNERDKNLWPPTWLYPTPPPICKIKISKFT